MCAILLYNYFSLLLFPPDDDRKYHKWRSIEHTLKKVENEIKLSPKRRRTLTTFVEIQTNIDAQGVKSITTKGRRKVPAAESNVPACELKIHLRLSFSGQATPFNRFWIINSPTELSRLSNVSNMMIQSRCKFKLKRIKSALGIIYSCLTYTTLIIGLILIPTRNGKLSRQLCVAL